MIEKHPVDPESLNKGDFISVDRVEQIFGLDRSHPHFGLRVLELGKFISGARSDLYVIGYKGGLLICSDEQASSHNKKRHESLKTSLYRNMKRRSRVDASQLEDPDTHHRSTRLMAGEVFALMRAEAQLPEGGDE